MLGLGLGHGGRMLVQPMRNATPRRPAVPDNLQQAQVHELSSRAATGVVDTAGDLLEANVVEVGAGSGMLTAALLAAGAKVWAVERDGDALERLRQRCAPALAHGRLTIIAGDILSVRPQAPAPWRVVANPPFNLTAPLVRRWLEGGPTAMHLVLQREAAEKLTGRDGNWTRMAVLSRLSGAPTVCLGLERADVTPPARVDLAVWAWWRRPDGPRGQELVEVDQLLEVAFAGPHTVRDALRGLATKMQIDRNADLHRYTPDAHPRSVPPLAWLDLARHLAMCGKLPHHPSGK